jgi:hypothetical protein
MLSRAKLFELLFQQIQPLDYLRTQNAGAFLPLSDSGTISSTIWEVCQGEIVG